MIKGIEKIKQKFSEFQAAHDTYHETIAEEGDIDVSDTYIYEVQDDYIAALSSTIIKDG